MDQLMILEERILHFLKAENLFEVTEVGEKDIRKKEVFEYR